MALPSTVAADEAPFRPVQRVLDLSGLAWLGADTFLAVHGAKNPGENMLVRVSLLQLPRSLDGILSRLLRPSFPGGPSSDLESAARIPGTEEVWALDLTLRDLRALLVEGRDDASAFERIFLAEIRSNRINVVGAVEWGSSTDAFNVEATSLQNEPRFACG